MKIKVIPEGREGVYIPDKESLKAWIREKGWEEIHNFIPTSGMFVGADHSTESVLEDIDTAERVALVLENAGSMNLGHALSIIKNNKLEVYNIGKITSEDLEIEN